MNRSHPVLAAAMLLLAHSAEAQTDCEPERGDVAEVLDAVHAAAAAPLPFDPGQPSSLANVRYAVELAAAAYKDAAEFDALAGRFGFTQTHFFDASTNLNAKHAQAGVGLRPGVGIFITYRGSESVIDWVRDLTATHTHPGDFGHTGEVHTGFSRHTNDLWKDISAEVRKTLEENPDLPVYFVGHSLGGAVARLAIARVMTRLDAGELPGKLGAIYTFGAPAIGDEAFEEAWVDRLARHGATYVRVRNDNDPVPLMPAVRFRHSARNVVDMRLRNGRIEHTNDFSGNAFRRLLRVGGAAFFVTDHFIDNYVDGVGAPPR